MSAQTRFQVTYGLVTILDKLVQERGSKDFASYLAVKPREGIATLMRCIEIAPEASHTTKTPQGFSTTTATNDPAQIKKFANELSADYDGKTVEVKLGKKYGGHTTIKVAIPAAK